MPQKSSAPTMIVPTIIMALLAIICFIIAVRKGGGQHIAALKLTWKMTIEILPLLAFAFILAGLVQVLLPRELIAKWVGQEAGLKGLLIGTLAGAIAPGGPYVSLPLAAGLWKAGAGTGTMVAFLTGWSLIAVGRMPMEFGILGWQLTTIRLLSTFFFAPIAGWIAQQLSHFIK